MGFLYPNNMRKIYIKYIQLLLLIVSSFQNFAQQQTSVKYVCQGILNLDSDANFAISSMNRMAAIGCNSALLTVWWERVYPQPNSKPNWAQLDNQINHAVNKLGHKVAIRIHLGRNYSLTKGFWEEEEAVKDFKGKVLTNYYDNNHFSFAHQPSVDKARGFVKEVCERYKSYQQSGKIIFISVVNTPQQELGFTYQNQQWPEKEYPAIFDHSKWAMIKFKDWAREKYTTIRTLNTYWGTNYKSFLEVEPYVNWWNINDSFRGRRGKDWFIFRHLMIKNYYEQMVETIKSVDSSYKVASEYGGVSDNLSILRNTLAFKDLSVKSDYLKTSIEGFQGDITYSNTSPNQKLYTEVAFFDLPTSDELKNYVKRAASYNIEFIMLIIESDNQSEYDKFLPAFQEAVKAMKSPPSNIVFTDSVKYRVSQLTDSRELVVNDWKTRSNNGQQKVKVILEEDLILENKKIENPLPDIVETNPIIPPPPIVTPPSNTPNQLPKESITAYTKEIVVNQNFQFRIPENLYYDTDGFIAYIEMIEAPRWIDFNRFELNFYGKAPYLGKYKIRVKVYDNAGGFIESAIYVEIVPPIIDFELIKGDYFDVPIQPYGYIFNKRTLYLDALPDLTNIIAHCNLDTINMVFELNGPYKFKRSSDKIPYNLFGEGRGLKFPVGTYTLSAKAYKLDSVISSKTIQFYVKASTQTEHSMINDWVVYPNPFQKICNLRIPDVEDTEKLSFVYYTIGGKKYPIKKEHINIVDKIAYIDLSEPSMPAGNYILEVSRGTEVIKTIKITKND